MPKMSVQRALTELKNVSSRIENGISSLNLVKAHQKGKNIGPQTVESFVNSGKENLQSITDLVKRASKLKTAINMSNTVTEVTVAGKTMTVLEAIIKKDVIKHEAHLLAVIEHQLLKETRTMDAKNVEVSERAENLAKSFLSADSKTDAAGQVKKIQDDFIESNNWLLANGTFAHEFVSLHKGETQEFLNEVDFTLSESNAVTLIEIED
jgi:hypothetical protein